MSDGRLRIFSTYEEGLLGIDKSTVETRGNGGGGGACLGRGRASGSGGGRSDRWAARTEDRQELHEGEVSILGEVVDVENERSVPVVPRVL